MIEFAWTFPCFILANRYSLNPDTGAVLLDESLGFIAPISPQGAFIALFTDIDLANDYREKSGLPETVRPIAIPGPTRLLEFLTRASCNFQKAIVDFNTRTKRGIPLDIAGMIAVLEQQRRQ